VRVLLVTPPMTQVNTPYPATAYLTGYLASRGYAVAQADLSLETALGLFSRAGIARLFQAVRAGGFAEGRALSLEPAYVETIEPAVRFLQGGDPTFAHRILRGVLPEGPRFDAAELDPEWAFGALGQQDRARWLATLYLYDLADLAQRTVAPEFGLSRYGEALARAAASFDGIARALRRPPGLIDAIAEEALAAHLERERPDLVGLTVPFPGNLYGALRAAEVVRRRLPSAKIALGGGYVNTELREIEEPRLFRWVDYVTLDDGERPMECMVEHLAGAREEARLKRTLALRDGKIVRLDGAEAADVSHAALPAPSYRGLPLDRYLSVIEIGNPMHRLWSDGRWAKLTVAHGCYWKKCTFCDVGLDYIARYEPARARDLVDRMDTLAAETGASGFHFVDEAAPPLSLVEVALELLERGRSVSWWGNIRFEKTFTRDVCRLLAASGCIAVSGGLEVASDRLLELMQKGVTVAQVARVAGAFTEAGVLVHAYLMYGFPTETAQETIDSLERVRQLFEAGVVTSGFWHRFALTQHSPIAAEPKTYRIRIVGGRRNPFANNDLRHADPTGADPERFGEGLARALYNYMHGVGLDRDVRSWFADRVPRAKVPKDLVSRAVADDEADPARPDARLVWLGGAARAVAGRRPGLALSGRGGEALLELPAKVARWAEELVREATPLGRGAREWPRRPQAEAAHPGAKRSFEGVWARLRAAGLAEIP
jgi:Radical SAM superfamily